MPHFLRLHFSLLTLLLLTTIAAMGVAVWRLGAELIPLRQEVRRLRNEVGELHIKDPAKLHTIHVETDNELEWKWRIWIPEGARYRLRAFGGLIPAQGYPTEGGAIWFREPGEHVLRYLIRRDPRNGKWYGSLHTRSGSAGKDEQQWVEWSSRSSTSGGVGNATRMFEVDKVIELIRHRVSEKATRSTDIEDPAAGFMVWLEPI